MRISYEPRSHTISFVLSSEPVARTDDSIDGFLVDLDAQGRILAVEVLDAEHMGDFRAVREAYDAGPLLAALEEERGEIQRRAAERHLIARSKSRSEDRRIGKVLAGIG